MAVVLSGGNVKLFSIKRFLGLNESLDGDTQFQLGEASEMQNWRVTPQYHLRIRPGLKTISRFAGPVRGLWCGELGGTARVVCAAGGKLWAAAQTACREAAGASTPQTGLFSEIGTLSDDRTSFFGFGNKLYVLNGHEYLSWDGTGRAAEVEGYVPLVVTASPPSGGGIRLENVNRLTAKRRARFSADGAALEYVLPERNLASIDRVEVNGAPLAANQWSGDRANGKVAFSAAPAKGTENVEIFYTAASSLRAQVTAMRCCETYNGSTDTRVFLYGDGTNKTIYSGLTEQGMPTAEYFPDLYEISVDSANTPVTGMIKQFSYLMVFKPDGAFSVQYTAVTLSDGSVTAGFYVSPINREIGNEALGQVRLVYNNPRTLYAGNAYDWLSVSTGRDERRARLVSERAARTLHAAALKQAVSFDNEREQEYYLFLNDAAGAALVHRYSGGDSGVWYRYTGLPARCAARDGEAVYLGLADGRLCDFSEKHTSDDGTAIPCVWKSGNMDFGADFQRKYSSLVWVSLKPDSHARLSVSAQTDKRTTYSSKLVPANLATFTAMDFRHFSFITNRNPQIERVRLKVKKFAFYKLVLSCDEDAATTTVLGVDIRVRYTGYVK